MRDLPSRRLADLVEVRHGFAFEGRYFRDESTTNILLTPGNFAVGGGFLPGAPKYYDGPVPADFVLAEGDLLVTMTDLSKNGDTLGYPAWVPPAPAGRRFLHNQRLGKILLRPKAPLDPRYLYYVLCSREYRHEVLATATGSTVRHTSPSRIGAYELPLPHLDVQQRVAGILGALDDKIALNRRTNETLESMARALFEASFGVPKTDHAPSALGDVADVIDCLHAKKPDRRDVGRPLLHLGNIRDDGLLDMSDSYLIDDRDYQFWTSRVEARPGDCVITNVGRVGAVAQIPLGVSAALGRNMTAVRCRPNFPYPTFLLEALRSDAMRAEIERKTDTGTILSALNVRNIPRLQLPTFDRDVIERYERVARPLRARMEVALAESHSLRKTRDVLLPGLLSGAPAA